MRAHGDLGRAVRAVRADRRLASPSAADDLGESYQAIVVGLRDYVAQERLLQRADGPVRRHRLHRSSPPSPSTRSAPTTSSASPTRASGRPSTPGPTPPSWPDAPACDSTPSRSRRSSTRTRRRCKLDGLAEENLQARIRAVIWMGLSNQHGHLVLACGNKSELATGYSTIYGDAVGGYAPIKDVPKTLVWELARWRNAWRRAARRDAADPREHDQQAAVGRAAPRAARLRLAAAVRAARRRARRLRRARPRLRRRRRRGVRPGPGRAGRHASSTRPSTSAASTRPAPRSRKPQLRPRPPGADHQRWREHLWLRLREFLTSRRLRTRCLVRL